MSDTIIPSTRAILKEIEDVLTLRAKPAEPRKWFNNWKSTDGEAKLEDLKMPSNRTTGLEIVHTYVQTLCKSRLMFEKTINDGNRCHNRYIQERDECLGEIYRIDKYIQNIIGMLFGEDLNPEMITVAVGDISQTMSVDECRRREKDEMEKLIRGD